MIPYLAVGQFFGRFGCLAAGCCWGKITNLPWGIEFPAGTMAFRQHAQEGLLEAGATHALAIHPTQLYDSFTGLVLLGLLLWIRQRKRYHGHVFIWWMFLYPLMRSTVELFRGDDAERGFVFEYVNEPLNQLLGLPVGSTTFLSTSQFISLCVVVVAGVMLFRRRHRRDDVRTAVTPDADAP
jgi:prolipoprotein diacylglyceryltransferase